jgi:hypothetical protein
MAKESWKTTETELEIARHGCVLQAESRGIDVTEPNMASFIDNQVKVIATANAEIRWLRAIIDEMASKIHKVEPES